MDNIQVNAEPETVKENKAGSKEILSDVISLCCILTSLIGAFRNIFRKMEKKE